MGACASFRPAVQLALDGRLLGQHRTLLQHLLAHIDFLEESIAKLEAEIEQCLAPFGQAVALAQTLPGIAETAATAIIAELGTDMSRFASDKHLASWAGVCPGNKQSGGKRLSGKTTHGNPYLRAVLGEVAWRSAIPKTITYLPSFTALPGAGASKRRWWRSRIASWSSCPICCAKASPTAISAQITLRNWRPPRSSGIMCGGWSSSATRSR